MNADPGGRLQKLETHFAHVERLAEQLNEIVTEQGREITRLKMQLKRVTQTVEGQEMERVRSTNAKPPHYQ